MSLSLELEIKSLLQTHEEPLRVAEELIKLFDDPSWEWSAETLRELYRFLWSCGLYQQLIGFVFKNMSKTGFVIPWPYLIEALVRGVPELEAGVISCVARGIEEEKAQEQVCIARGADRFIQQTIQWKTELRRKRLQNLKIQKEQALDQLLTLRTQQLYEQEKNLLGKLQRMFPGDAEILTEVSSHKQRYALEILSRKTPLNRGTSFKEPAPDEDAEKTLQALRSSLLENAALHPDMTFDFAVLAFMLEDFDTSLQLLGTLPALAANEQWFKMEALLKARRFLEVLHGLSEIEIALATEPETFFATAYLRAQAYWGLAQKHLALEILESLLQARPNYRAGTALLDLWRSA